MIVDRIVVPAKTTKRSEDTPAQVWLVCAAESNRRILFARELGREIAVLARLARTISRLLRVAIVGKQFSQALRSSALLFERTDLPVFARTIAFAGSIRPRRTIPCQAAMFMLRSFLQRACVTLFEIAGLIKLRGRAARRLASPARIVRARSRRRPLAESRPLRPGRRVF